MAFLETFVADVVETGMSLSGFGLKISQVNIIS